MLQSSGNSLYIELRSVGNLTCYFVSVYYQKLGPQRTTYPSEEMVESTPVSQAKPVDITTVPLLIVQPKKTEVSPILGNLTVS